MAQLEVGLSDDDCDSYLCDTVFLFLSAIPEYGVAHTAFDPAFLLGHGGLSVGLLQYYQQSSYHWTFRLDHRHGHQSPWRARCDGHGDNLRVWRRELPQSLSRVLSQTGWRI